MPSASKRARSRAASSFLKLAAASLIAVSIAASATVPAKALFLDKNVVEKIEFVIGCKRLLIEDAINGTNIHTEVCGVGDISGSASKWIGSNSVERDDYCRPYPEGNVSLIICEPER